MEEKKTVKFEQVLDTEINDIWDIFFPYMAEKKEKPVEIKAADQPKPRRHLKFLSM